MIDKLVELHKNCFPDKNWNKKDFLDLKKSGCEIISSINSFIIYKVIFDEAEIITIGVNVDKRNQGLATSLITLMIKDLQEKKVKNIFLEVSINNLQALRLYEKFGFQKISIRKKYYDGIDAVVMKKNI